MCRRKPGPRCYRHSATSLASSQSRYGAARERVRELLATDHPSPQLVGAATRRLTGATIRLGRAEREFYATRTGGETLDKMLAQDDLPDDRRTQLRRVKAQSAALKLSRKAQVDAMPPEPPEGADTGLQRAYDALGRYRAVLADVDAQVLGSHGNRPPAELVELRESAERDAFVADVEYRIAAAGEKPNPAYLHPGEQAALVTTPAARKRITYLSHMRAAAEHGQHSTRMTNLIADREDELRDKLREDAPPVAEKLPPPAPTTAPPTSPAPSARTADTADTAPEVPPPPTWAKGQPWQRTTQTPAWRTAWNALRSVDQKFLSREGLLGAKPGSEAAVVIRLEELFGL